MNEPNEADIYDRYFGADGQPVRSGVVLSDAEAREYALFFAETTPHTLTEETHP